MSCLVGLALQPDDEIRGAILHTWPVCPAHVVALFVELLRASAEALVARGVLTLEKPYGRSHILAESSGFGIAFMQMNPGQSSSYHYHHERRELIWVRAGHLTLLSDSSRRLLGPGGYATTEPLCPHAAANEGGDVVEAVELIHPFLLDDKVRLEDRYLRRLGPVTHRE
jgi:mannose-6-phosphate isomerase-like protein (cupin superfamily)